jgi:outer membrane receptor for ferrienterochelin and colicins
MALSPFALLIAGLWGQLDAGQPSVNELILNENVTPAANDQRITVVTATRTERHLDEVVAATEVISRQQIERTQARDLTQLLAQHPGVELVYTNRAVGLRLQGLDPEYVLILVDGQRVAGRAGSVVDISRFSLRDLERVEIVKGPAAALYGADAMGGVVNLVTRRPQKTFEANLRGLFGTLLEGDVRGNASAKLGHFELQGGAGFRTRQPFDWNPPGINSKSGEPTGDVATSLPGQRRLDGDVSVAFIPHEKLRLSLRSDYARNDFDAVDVNDTGAIFDRRQRTEQFNLWAGLVAQPWREGSLTIRGHGGLFRDQFLLDQRSARTLDDYTQSFSRLWEGYAQVDQRFGNHQVALGSEVLVESLNSARLETTEVQRVRVGAFAQDEWKVTSPGGSVLVLLPGLRFDVDSQFGSALSPRLAAKVTVTEAVNVRVSYGLGFRPPSFSELYLSFTNAAIGYVVEGNTRLVAETSGSVNASVDAKLNAKVTLSASAWHTSLKNLINVTGNGAPNPDNPTRFSYENVANAYTQGVEVSAQFKINRDVAVDVSYMGLAAEDLTRNRPLEGRSNHRLNAQVSGRYRPWRLDGLFRATVHGARPFYLGAGGGAISNSLGFGEAVVLQAPAYADVELQLNYALRPWLKLFVNASNLFNQGDAQFNPRPPRSVMGGLTVLYDML